eukprot:scaffold153_cov314-Prasinococcus_capsulatus_cf.AAC.6
MGSLVDHDRGLPLPSWPPARARAPRRGTASATTWLRAGAWVAASQRGWGADGVLLSARRGSAGSASFPLALDHPQSPDPCATPPSCRAPALPRRPALGAE